MTIGQMTIGQMTIGQMTIGQMTNTQETFCDVFSNQMTFVLIAIA